MDAIVKKQICSIEQAKKLKELGLNQNSLLHYIRKENSPTNVFTVPSVHSMTKKHLEGFESYSAYTITELKAFLPYGRAEENMSVLEVADMIIDLLENEITFTVDECNLNFFEFFDIDEILVGA